MTEMWKTVAGYEGLYEVSDRGEVRSVDHLTIGSDGRTRKIQGKLLRPAINPQHGHLMVSLSRGGVCKSHNVHSLVMGAFAGSSPPDQETRHFNGDSADNRWPENLIYGTRKQNMEDARRHGTLPCGERSWRAKLKENDILIIRQSRETNVDLAERFSVNEATIRKIRNRERWTHV